MGLVDLLRPFVRDDEQILAGVRREALERGVEALGVEAVGVVGLVEQRVELSARRCPTVFDPPARRAGVKAVAGQPWRSTTRYRQRGGVEPSATGPGTRRLPAHPGLRA